MPIHSRHRLAMLAFLALAGGCDNTVMEAGSSQAPSIATSGVPVDADQADLTRRADVAFLREARRRNALELAMATLARQRGSHATDGLAATLLRDQAALQGSLASLAGGGPVPPVPVPGELRRLDGAQFDARFLTLLRDQHALSVSKFEMAANDAALSAGVRRVASDALPTLHRNLRSIQALQEHLPLALARNARIRDNGQAALKAPEQVGGRE